MFVFNLVIQMVMDVSWPCSFLSDSSTIYTATYYTSRNVLEIIKLLTYWTGLTLPLPLSFWRLFQGESLFMCRCGNVLAQKAAKSVRLLWEHNLAAQNNGLNPASVPNLTKYTCGCIDLQKQNKIETLTPFCLFSDLKTQGHLFILDILLEFY